MTKPLLSAALMFAFGARSSNADSPPTACATPIMIEVKAPKSGAKLMVRLGGRDYDFAGLLRQLSSESARCGKDRPVHVLVSDRQPLGLLNELRGLLSKAGLVNGRYYVVSSLSGKMYEIMFG